MSGPTLRVAVLGAGTVGREVVRAFLERPEALRAATGVRLELVGVAVRDVERAIGRGIPRQLVTDAPAHLVAAPATDVIVELMGGEEPARTIIAAALAAGKDVVTANKHVLARHGPDLEEIARRTSARLRFEAAVGGGIPILAPLAADLAANRIERLRGIVNGTTNYILTAMAEQAMAYEDALAAAQEAGYAEADPSADVDGIDAANKLVVLARLALGGWLDPAAIPTAPGTTAGGAGAPGIRGVTATDVAAAAERGLALKLLVTAERRPDDPADAPPEIAAAVGVAAVPTGSALGRTAGIDNRIEIRADPIGWFAVEGPGAGGGPTSSAVLGDLLAIAAGGGSTWATLRPARPATVAPLPEPEAWLDAPSGLRYPVVG